MWPFKRKDKNKREGKKKVSRPDYSRLVEQDKKMPSEEDLERMDSSFRDKVGYLMTKVLRRKKRL